MRAYDLIRRKRDGGVLSSGELAWLVEGFVSGAIPDYQMSALLMAAYFRGLGAVETAALTEAMVASGETLDLGPLAARCVDKHSTGGVGDKTSLVLVPLVASAGVAVPKLSGRGLGHTGGTLDKLEAIPGFSTSLSMAEFTAQVERIGCAIAGQSASFVPADARLYALRDVTATVDSIPLIASSVMSKKIASGAAAIMLDVKFGRGAFMKDEAEARDLAGVMVGIGAAAGRRTMAAITAMEHPLGRAVGNALEVREAVATLRGEGPADLADLCLALGARMLVLGGVASSYEEGEERLRSRIESGAALEKFREMVRAQGGSAEALDDADLLPAAPVALPVPAPAGGYVAEIDAEAVGLAAMRLGAGRTAKEDLVDHAVGVVVERAAGSEVGEGDSVATVHARTEASGRAAVAEVAAAFSIGPGPVEPRPLIAGFVEQQRP